MTKTFATLTLLSTACAFAQTPPTVGRMLDNQLRSAEREIVSLIEAMPASKIDFAPTQGEFKGVRTFGQQAKHLAAVVYLVAAAAKGEKPPVDTGGENGPASIQKPADIVKFAKDAFAYAHGVALAMTAENLTQMVKSPFGDGQTTKGALISEAVWHSFDHYGQMVVYARMNGIVPPASRPPQK
jgi:uncharacterized damage-inducible protein DinB